MPANVSTRKSRFSLDCESLAEIGTTGNFGTVSIKGRRGVFANNLPAATIEIPIDFCGYQMHSSIGLEATAQNDAALDFDTVSIQGRRCGFADKLAAATIEIPIDFCVYQIHSSIGFDTTA